MFGTVQSIDLVYQPLSNRQLTWIVLVESEVSSLLRMLQIFAYQVLVCARCAGCWWVSDSVTGNCTLRWALCFLAGTGGRVWRTVEISLYIQTTGRPARLPPAQELSTTTNIKHSKRLHRSPSHQGLMAPIFQLKYWATVSPTWFPSGSNFPCVWASVAVAAPDRVPLSHISEIITINTISPQPPACFRVARHSWWLSTHHQILHFPNDWKICPSPKRPKIPGICGQYNPHISHLSTHIFSHTSERGRQQPAIICELFLY